MMNEMALKARFTRIENSINALTVAVNALLEQTAPRREELLTIGAAAKELGITTAALRQRVNRGKVNCHYEDGRYYFEREYISTLPKSR